MFFFVQQCWKYQVRSGFNRSWMESEVGSEICGEVIELLYTLAMCVDVKLQLSVTIDGLVMGRSNMERYTTFNILKFGGCQTLI